MNKLRFYPPSDQDLSPWERAWADPYFRIPIKIISTVLFVILIFWAINAMAIDLPKEEQAIINEVADEYNLAGEARLLLFVIRRVENGRTGREFGVLHPRAVNTDFRTQCEWAAGTIRKRFSGDLRAFALRWCPPSAHSLNKNWYPNAKFYMEKWK